MAQVLLVLELRKNPCRTCDQFAQAMSAYGFDVNRDFIRRTFVRNGITLKAVQSKHVLKFTLRNILYTMNYLLFIKGVIDWRTLKFADESSFESKGAA